MAELVDQNIFPLYVTIEHVENGFILQKRGDGKFVCSPGEIYELFGRLFHLEQLRKDAPIVIKAEAMDVSQVNGPSNSQDLRLLEAKLKATDMLYFSDEKLKGSILVLQDADKYEIFGRQVQDLLKFAPGKLESFLKSDHSISFIQIPSNVANRKMLSQLATQNNKRLCVHDVGNQDEFVEKIENRQKIATEKENQGK